MPGLLSCAVPALFALCLPLVLALPNGAPLGSCTSLMPSHSGTSPQTSDSPHTIAAIYANNTVEVMIIGADYRGLLLQGREYGGDVAVGNWAKLPKNTKVISCFNIENSAITHSNAELKSGNTVYTWNPPRKNKCGLRVEFVATVAQSRAVYWTGLKSDEINAVPLSYFSILCLTKQT
ncbi:putative defense protein isoform X2 [Leucoraja erinacea]|uniref:putative defense protein isoform X2 n=1 Tax=Leucoraja erinaceus TaxID=7782 RepID=UPI0024565D2B|nr:putative defense protein isoform X2 [Leucoraja erinacea]